MQRNKRTIQFTGEQIKKYSSSEISGTGYLAYRDIIKFSLFNEVIFSKVLDLGCGAGRSTKFLSKFCDKVSGVDISEGMLNIAEKALPDHKFYINNHKDETYPFSPYTVIYSILMFFHFSNIEDIRQELKKCFDSLINLGYLIIINGTRNLYTQNYLSVKGIGKPPENDGDACEVELKSIDCKVKDYFWNENTIIEGAKQSGFTFVASHYPLGKNEDTQEYKDELEFPPYYYLAFKKI